MNKIQKRKQVKTRRLQQTKNRELNRALHMTYESHRSTEIFDAIEACKETSIRVLRHLAKEDVELPEGLSITNKSLFEAARNEIVERKLLDSK